MARVGRWIALVSLGLLLLSVAPIELYALLGPAEGDPPIGLELLRAFGRSLFGSTLAVGLLVWGVGWMVGRRRGGGGEG